ncbi:MAG: FprA family A-type flavoprotein [Bacilli bacterium]|jgi:flavorubredoxin|nr:FprA family A-type flavoprotein [Bacilli bacterium]
MNCATKIWDDLYYVGGSDRRIRKFENILPIHHGVSYNSYLFLDEKTCLMDTADQSISRLFLENVTSVLGTRKLDYLVIHHMEPDHCYNITEILLRYPEVQLVGNAQTFKMLHNFFPELDTQGKEIVVKDGDTLSLGKRKLHFYLTPMVHWPEVMMTFEETQGLLFTADAFGTFNALDGNLYADEVRYDRNFLDMARMYYTNIVGKYGQSVQQAFSKLPIDKVTMLLSLHGPIWRKDLGYIIDKYQKWSTYTPEEKGVIIIYATMYGDTENAADILARDLSSQGITNIKEYDASYTDEDWLVSESFRVSNIVIISPTYNMTIHPDIDTYLSGMMRMALAKRTFTLIQAGSWCPSSLCLMKAKMACQKTFTYTPSELTILSGVKPCDVTSLETIAGEIKKSLGE